MGPLRPRVRRVGANVHPRLASEPTPSLIPEWAHLLAKAPELDVFLDRARALAGQCTAALEVILHQTDQALLREQFDAALRSRAVIDQAIGILMVQQRCTAREAFDLLRQASQHRNRKPREVAAEGSTGGTNASGLSLTQGKGSPP